MLFYLGNLHTYLTLVQGLLLLCVHRKLTG